jgi:tRNA (guanine37-N1)-methyltransferase
MRIDIATLFPEMCQRVMDESIIGRAQRAGYISVFCHNIRDYSEFSHQRVDACPYGGGKGMLFLAEPITRCCEAIIAQHEKRPHVVYLSPKGRVFDQDKARELAQKDGLLLVCGHYEGVDERFIDEMVDEEISAGDFVLTGGELAALMVADAVGRLCEGVLADASCFTDDSHYDGLLEYPHYTRPPVWRGREVPPVLFSGHHANIEKWRRAQSLQLTARRRPDLLERAPLDEGDREYLRRVTGWHEDEEPGADKKKP